MTKIMKSGRRLWNATYLFLIISSLLSACATPSSLNIPIETKSSSSLEKYLNNLARLDKVAANLFKTALPLCEVVGHDPGLFTHTRSQFPKHLKEAVRTELGAGATPTVNFIRENGPASALQIGDVLLGLDDTPVEVNSRDVQTYLAAGFLRLRRGGAEMIMPVSAPRTCAYRVHLKDASKINAKMSGGQISITIPMMDFFASDDELAYVIGHELAHGFKNHMNIAISSGGILGLSPRKMRAIETQADYAALTLLAVSGYNIDAANEFWQRLNSAIAQGQIKSQPMISQKRLSDIRKFSKDVNIQLNNGKSLADMQKPLR